MHPYTLIPYGRAVDPAYFRDLIGWIETDKDDPDLPSSFQPSLPAIIRYCGVNQTANRSYVEAIDFTVACMMDLAIECIKQKFETPDSACDAISYWVPREDLRMAQHMFDICSVVFSCRFPEPLLRVRDGLYCHRCDVGRPVGRIDDMEARSANTA